MKTKRTILLIGAFLLLSMPRITTAENFYSLQVLSIPKENYKEGLIVYQKLIKKGYFAYYYKGGHRGYRDYKEMFRLMVGCFRDSSCAEKFSKRLKKDGFPNYVDRAPVHVQKYKDSLEAITTPSAIWLRSKGRGRIIYTLKRRNRTNVIIDEVNDDIAIDEVNPDFSPDGKYIVFYYAQRIIRINIETGQAKLLAKGELLSSQPRWSPDGNYIAYMDNHEWEVQTNLWLMDGDGNNKKIMVNTKNTDDAVFNFYWHPKLNVLFYATAYAWGTCMRGCNIYSKTIDGKRKLQIKAEERKGRMTDWNFTIKNDTIFYDMMRGDRTDIIIGRKALPDSAQYF